ncbi:matrixin family metalloprotease [Isosphaeraceae bacterium EP7]
MTRQGILAPAPARRRSSKFRPQCEALDVRALMTVVPGYDYVLSGLSWANPAKITYSVAPDGVFWDRATNNLAAELDAKIGPNVWRRELARSLQTWASVANINIVAVNDGAYAQNATGAAQGDPRFGDIRFGGFGFASSGVLAQTYFPPPNLSTAGGDVEVNTSQAWQMGKGLDLFSVMLHETGHSLGLDHVKDTQEVMRPVYGGVLSGLSEGDIAGIRAIYGARTADAMTLGGKGTAPSNALDVTPGLNSAYAAVLGGYSLATIGQVEYFSVVAPSNATGASLVASAVASGSSLLSPSITVYDASMRPISSAANPASWGNDVTAGAAGVVAGNRYIIGVKGATNDVFAVGAYQLALSFQGIKASAPVPVAPIPVPVAPTPPAIVQVVPPATPISPVGPAGTQIEAIAADRFEANNTSRVATRLGIVNRISVGGLSLHTPSDVDFYTFRAAKSGAFSVQAPGQSLVVLDTAGRVLARGVGTVTFKTARAGSLYNVAVGSSNGAAVANYTLTIASQPKAQVVVQAGRKVKR